MGQETFPAEYKPISDKKALAADIYGIDFMQIRRFMNT